MRLKSKIALITTGRVGNVKDISNVAVFLEANNLVILMELKSRLMAFYQQFI